MNLRLKAELILIKNSFSKTLKNYKKTVKTLNFKTNLKIKKKNKINSPFSKELYKYSIS